MSLLNSQIHRFDLPNVDTFAFGESTIYGYDYSQHNLKRIEMNEISVIDLYFSIDIPNEIKEMKLNPDETILALLSNEKIYFVYLPQIQRSSSFFQFCPVNILSLSRYNYLIDFVWLTSNDLIIVNSIPSSSECHLYRIKSSGDNPIEFVEKYSVGSSKSKRKSTELTTKKYSLDNFSEIVQLTFTKRTDESSTKFLLFALKSDGDIYLMEIDEDNNRESFFVGPIRILPSSYDNYGADYSHSKLNCFCLNSLVIVMFTNGKNSLNECVLLNPVENEFYFFAIDSICLSNGNSIQSMIFDRLNEKIFYLIDSLRNIYSIEINWIEQIERKSSQINRTIVQHLFKLNSHLLHCNFTQTKTNGQSLTFITKTINDQQKELIFVRPNSVKNISVERSEPVRKFNPVSGKRSASEFVQRIQTILQREESIPEYVHSASKRDWENAGFQDEILQLIDEEYFQRQNKVRTELENKQRYLTDFQQTHFVALVELKKKYEQIYQLFTSLMERYQQEYLRQKQLLEKANDLLSNIEGQNPVVSDAQILMQRQLIKFGIQMNYLKEKFVHLQRFLSEIDISKRNEKPIDQSALDRFQEFILYYRDQIDAMKQRIHTNVQNNN